MVEFAGFEMPLNYNGQVGNNIAGGPGEYFFRELGLHGVSQYVLCAR